MRTLLRKMYWGLRRIVRGKGLSRVSWVKDLNFRLEKFLRGKAEEFIEKRGFRIYMDPSGYLSQKFQDFEPEETAFVESVLKPGDTFVDVGASIGWYTLNAARKVGASGRVYAFEPDPRSVELLRKNVAANGFGNVTVVPKAVSETNGSKKFFLRKTRWANNSFYDPLANPKVLVLPFVEGSSVENFSEEVEIETISLDDYLKDVPVNVIKMDTEGAEHLVQKGALRTLRNNRGIVVISEFIPLYMASCGGNPAEFLRTFADLGFSVYEISDEAKKIVPVTTEELLRTYTSEKMNGTNLIFSREHPSS